MALGARNCVDGARRRADAKAGERGERGGELERRDFEGSESQRGDRQQWALNAATARGTDHFLQADHFGRPDGRHIERQGKRFTGADGAAELPVGVAGLPAGLGDTIELAARVIAPAYHRQQRAVLRIERHQRSLQEATRHFAQMTPPRFVGLETR